MMSDTQSVKEKDVPVVKRTFEIIDQIGSGTFGVIYKAQDLDNGQYVALKTERSTARNPQLKLEYMIYQHLDSERGIPRVYGYFSDPKYNAMVMQLLGPSLEDLFNYCKLRFSLKTVLMLAEQMIARVQFVHEKGYIHRDIKPSNFVVGTGATKNEVYIIDFGLAKKFFCAERNTHIPMSYGNQMIGTTRYASANALMGNECSRRDDMESLGYVLMYFLRGALPWQGFKAPKPQVYEMLAEKKLSTNFVDLCKGHPVEFLQYLVHIRNTEFYQAPNYLGIRRSFRNLFTRLNYVYDSIFYWHEVQACKSNTAEIVDNKNNEPILIEDNTKESEEE